MDIPSKAPGLVILIIVPWIHLVYKQVLRKNSKNAVENYVINKINLLFTKITTKCILPPCEHVTALECKPCDKFLIGVKLNCHPARRITINSDINVRLCIPMLELSLYNDNTVQLRYSNREITYL